MSMMTYPMQRLAAFKQQGERQQHFGLCLKVRLEPAVGHVCLGDGVPPCCMEEVVISNRDCASELGWGLLLQSIAHQLPTGSTGPVHLAAVAWPHPQLGRCLHLLICLPASSLLAPPVCPLGYIERCDCAWPPFTSSSAFVASQASLDTAQAATCTGSTCSTQLSLPQGQTQAAFFTKKRWPYFRVSQTFMCCPCAAGGAVGVDAASAPGEWRRGFGSGGLQHAARPHSRQDPRVGHRARGRCSHRAGRARL